MARTRFFCSKSEGRFTRLALAAMMATTLTVGGCSPATPPLDDGGPADGGPADGGPSPVAARLTLSELVAQFGTVVVGGSSAATTLTVTNSGGQASSSISVSLTGSNASDFSLDADSCDNTELAAGDSCTIQITFSPSAAGNRAATLAVQAEKGGDASTTLAGTGTEPGALSISPTPHTFATTVVDATSDAQDFVVTNPGPAATGALTATLSGGDATQFEITNNGCDSITLQANASCTISARFAPTSAGARATELRVLTGSAQAGAVAILTGQAVDDARLRLSPSSRDFSLVTAGETGGEVTFTVENEGGIASGEITTALSGDFVIVSDACADEVLAADEECLIIVRFAPASAGAKTGSLVVSAAPGGERTSDLTGEGVAAGEISISAAAPFGNVTVGQAGTAQTLTVRNTGGSATGELGTALTGAHVSDFSISSNSCAETILAADATCTINLNFQPTGEGARTASLTVTGEPGGAVATELEGVGLAAPPPAVLAIDQATRNFGSVARDNQSNPLAVTVRNTGGQPSGTPSLLLVGLNAGEFQIVGHNCNSPLAPGATCEAQVRFIPTSPTLGSKSATFQASASPGGTATSALSGTSVNPAQITSNPTTISFGSVVNGGSSGATNVVVTNNGAAVTGPLSSSIGGDFETVDDGCDELSLPLNASCTIAVRFSPSFVGEHDDELTVTGSPGGTTTVALGGLSLPEYSVVGIPETGFPATNTDSGTSQVTYTVTNTAGVGSKTRTFIVPALPANSDFAVTGGTCLVAPTSTRLAGGSCTIIVRFTPTGDPGARIATLVVNDNHGTSKNVALRGEAIRPLQFTVEPPPLPVQPDPSRYSFGPTLIGSAPEVTFRLTNRGVGLSGVLNTAFTPGLGSFGLLSDGCLGKNLTPGSFCEVKINFYPTQSLTTYAGDFTASSFASTATAYFSGSGLAPAQVALTSGNPDFGDIAVTRTLDRTFTFTNIGQVQLPAPAVSEPAGIFITNSTCTLALDPGASCDVLVRAAPVAATPPGATTATLTVGGLAVALTANVLSQLVITPDPAVFADQVVSTPSATRTFTVTNRGTTVVNAPSVTTTGNFAVNANNCGTVPLAGCTVLVTFSPTATGPREGTLVVNAGQVGVSPPPAVLSGNGIEAAYAFEGGAVLHHGNVALGSTGPTYTYTVKNTGNATGAAFTATFTGDAAHFNASGCAAQTLAPNATCDITVQFAPTDAGTDEKTVTIGGIPGATLQISGTRIAASALSFSAPRYVFQDEVVGVESSSVQTLTVTNTNPDDEVTGLAVVTPTDFCVGDGCTQQPTQNTCTGTLPAGGSCTVEVRFTPTAAGSLVRDLTLTSSAPTTSTRLEGTGLSPVTFARRDTFEAFPATGVGATSTMKLGFINNGDQATGAITVTRQGGTSADRIDYDNSGCAAGLDGGAECEVTVTFSPTAELTATETLRFTPVNGSPIDVTLTGSGIIPAALTVALAVPTCLDTVPVNVTTLCDFTVANTGQAATGDFTIGIAGANASLFTYTTTCPLDANPATDDTYASLGGGADCTGQVSYSPTTVGSHEATLNVSALAGTPGGSASASLAATAGSSLTSDLAAAGHGDFGLVLLDSFSSQTLTIANTAGSPSAGPLTVSLTGANGQYFITSTTCSGATLAAGAACSVTVTFAPTTLGTKTATLVVTNGTAEKRAQVSLTGASVSVVPVSTLTSDNQSFGLVRLDSSVSRTVTITNAAGSPSAGPLTVSLTGANGQYFVTSTTCSGATLAAGETCSVTVMFVPTMLGPTMLGTTSATLVVSNGTFEKRALVSLVGLPISEFPTSCLDTLTIYSVATAGQFTFDPDGLGPVAAFSIYPGAASDVYTIDPDGPGGNDPFSVYCDMTTDGGGWTLVGKVRGAAWDEDDGILDGSDSARWINRAYLGSVADLVVGDALGPAYESVPFTDFMLSGLQDTSKKLAWRHGETFPSLHAVFTSNAQKRATSVLVGNFTSLDYEANCVVGRGPDATGPQFYGFNVHADLHPRTYGSLVSGFNGTGWCASLAGWGRDNNAGGYSGGGLGTRCQGRAHQMGRHQWGQGDACRAADWPSGSLDTFRAHAFWVR
jgi:hypothetical protein